jgi:protein required for attachment to host cells
MTPIHTEHWIATADASRIALFTCRLSPGGDLRVEHARSLESPRREEHERHRPSLLAGARSCGTLNRSGTHAAPQAASSDRDDDEGQRRFARHIGAWLSHAARDLGAGQVSVFAAPRLLGLLREELERHPAVQADLHAGDFAHLRAAELAKHPAVRGVLLTPSGAAMR